MYKNILWGAGILSLFTVASCDKIKDFKDTNIDQNQTANPIPSALLTNVESLMGGQLGYDGGGLNTGAGLYAQYYSETQYTEVSRYNKPTYNYDGYYAGALEDLQNIINYNSDPATAEAAAAFGSNNNQIAIARILKAHYIKFLTDAVGDLPYFDAFQGKTGAITPKYDAQQAIYTDLLKELKEAVEQFDNVGLPIQGDIIFGGDVAKWKKYANSLRLLIALNMRKVDASTGQSEFNDALNNSAGVIEDNADNVTINYPGGVFAQPVNNYYVIVARLDIAVSETMTDQLTSTNDPRLSVFATSANGFPYGLKRDDAVAFAGANADWARLLAGTNTPSASSWTLLSAANIDLARAEAAQLGWTSEDVTTLFQNGIQANFDQWGLGDASVYYGGLTPDAEQIAIQEWLAFYPNGIEGWDVYRRTGFPALDPAPLQSNPVPRRTTYGTNDYSYNAGNVKAAAANYTVNGQPDSQWGRIWWDKQ
jgi:SusD/RagB-like outer membrane lipoprotein